MAIASKTKSAIRARGLVRRFDKKVAVNNLKLNVKRGEIYAFLGPNGAGKSTTIKMLVTLLVPTEGDAWVNGKSVVQEPTAVRLKIGVALQEAALDAQQTGIELLRLQGQLYGLGKAEISKRIGELSKLIDIGDALDQRIKTYSGGMKRRLDLAAALVHNPDILFLDEPTTGLDPISRAKVWEEVRHLNKHLGMTIFLTTQYLEEADQLSDRVGIISEGKLVVEGTPAELKRHVGRDLIIARIKGQPNGVEDKLHGIEGVQRVDYHKGELTIITKNGAAIVGKVAVVLDQAGIKVVELTLRTPTLDDVFLEVTGNRLERGDE